MQKQIQPGNLCQALQIILTLSILLLTGSNSLSDQLYVLTRKTKGVVLKIYDIGKNGKVRSGRSFIMNNFTDEKIVKIERSRDWKYEVEIKQVAVSPNLSFLACVYYLASPAIEHAEIRIYDLTKGIVIHKFSNVNPHGKFVWCNWQCNSVLRFSEAYHTKEDVGAYDLGEFHVTTGIRTHLKTKELIHDFSPEPDDYYRRSAQAAKEFNRLGFSPLTQNGREFDAVDFGIYQSNNRGAVSDDGIYAIAQILPPSLIHSEYIILKRGEVKARIVFPEDIRVLRLKLTDAFIVILTAENNRNRVYIYHRDSGRVASYVTGFVIVDH